MGLRDFGVAISDYKCFGPNPQGVSGIYPVNLLIGRNNSGKSTIIDLIDAFCKGGSHQNLIQKLPEMREDWNTKSWIMTLAGETDLSRVRNDVPWELYVQMPIEKKINVNHWWKDRWVISEFGQPHSLRPYEIPKEAAHLSDGIRAIAKKIRTTAANLLLNKKFERLRSDRDMVPESYDQKLAVKDNGAGATNMIQRYINDVSLPREIVKEIILDALNGIFASDAVFKEILVQKHTGNQWEVYLWEESKGLVALSQSGSGLRTVLLVLVFLYVAPYGKDLKDFVFAFEELENNLHPALQRRLFSFIRDFAVENKCHVILSTHSHVAIDLFSRDEEAQIIHVTHDGQWASARSVDTYRGRGDILTDLDVRASDLLQANAVVWVEGPSDQKYFNRWIELWTDGRLQEGRDYQCVYYGGSLLAHLSADDPAIVSEKLQVLRVNRNAIMLMDSDKEYLRDSLAEYKKRVRDEIEGNGGLAWVTKGREIEHYIPREALAAYYGKEMPEPTADDAYLRFEDYLDKIDEGAGRTYLNRKTVYATRISPLITREGLEAIPDLAEKLDAVVEKLDQWNGLAEFRS